MKTRILFLFTIITICLFMVSGVVLGQTISYTTVGSTYTQNFDGLPNTGTFTYTGLAIRDLTAAPVNATNMTGWYFAKNTGTGVNDLFHVENGAGTGGALKDYGSIGSTDRALGGLGSGTYAPKFGALITNNTGVTLNKFTITYTGEQWRVASNNENTLTFRYAVGATTINDASVTVSALNFASPVLSATASALDGNDAANRTTGITATVSGLNWENGTVLAIRWDDVDDPGSDNGIAIDDFSFSADVQPPINYYYKGTGNLHEVANWGTETDGSGSNPVNFTSDIQIFNIRNTSSVTTAAAWTVSGTGSKIVVGDGTNSITLTIANGFAITGTMDVSANATVVIQDASIPNFGSVASTSTIDYAQSGSVVVSNTTLYGNLKLTGGTKTIPSGNTTVLGNLVVDGVTEFTGAGTLVLAGNLTLQNGTTMATGMSLNCNGTSTQTITGNGTDISLFRFTQSNSAGVILSTTGGSSNLVITGTTGGNLLLGANTITTNSNYVSISGPAGTLSRTTGYIIGNFRKAVATGATALTFEVGTSSGYSPVNLAFGNVSVAGNITASAISGNHPNLATSGLITNKKLNRWYRLSNDGVAFDNCNVTFNFVSGDVDAGANTADFIVKKFDVGAWSSPTTANPLETSIQATGLTSLGDFAIGTPKLTITSAQSGNWSSGTTWVGGNVPTVSDNVIIATGHTVTVDVPITVDGATIVIDGYLKETAVITKTSGTWIVNGTYELNHPPASNQGVPTATWNVGSTCIITGVTNSTTGINANQNFYNFIVNCPNWAGNMNFGWGGTSAPFVPITIGGDVIVKNTGSGRWNWCAPVAGTLTARNAVTVTVNGNLIIDGSTSNATNMVSVTSNGTGNGFTDITINILGNVTVTGNPTNNSWTNFSISRGSQSGNGTSIWNFYGNVSVSDAQIQNSTTTTGGGIGKFVFAKSGEQSLTFTNLNPTSAPINIEVLSGSTLNIGSSTLTPSSGFFILSSGAGIITSHASGLNGNLTNTGEKTLSTGANYVFNGSSAQVTGALMPATVNNLTINNSSGVTLSSATTVNGTLTLTSGTLNNSTNTLTLGNGATISRAIGTLTAVPTFGASVNLVYIGTTKVTTGNEFPVSPSVLNNLTINNSAGVSLSGNTTVNGTLTLTNGIITTVANTLTVDASGAISGGSSSSYVDGKLALVYNSVGVKTFHIGKGGNYRPLTLNYTALTGTSTVTAEQFESGYPGTAPAGIFQVGSHYWSVTQSGGSDFSADLTLDGTGLTFIGTQKILKYNSPNTIVLPTTTPNYTVTGLTSFGDFALGEEILAPVAPVLVSPEDGATNQPIDVTLSWEPSSGAATYHLQVATDEGFTTLVFNDATLTTVSKQMSDLLLNTKYYWRVSASNKGGASPWSVVRNFTTFIESPAAPVLASPEDGATNQQLNVTLRWRVTERAVTYRLQLATDAGFVSLVVDDATLTDTLKQMSGLAIGTRYYWRVNATNVGGISPWSVIRNFTTGTTSVAELELAPKQFSLSQNYPNPFNPTTQIKFSVEKDGHASLSIYNILGQQVGRVFDGEAKAGRYYNLTIDGRNLTSGVYLYVLESGAQRIVKKLMLTK